MNTITLIGRLGKDPEASHFDNGDKIVKATLATSEKWKDKTSGERKEVTDWHNITFTRQLAEVAHQYLKKGALICVVGKQRHRKYEKDGKTQYFSEVDVRDLEMLGGRDEQQAPAAPTHHALPEQAPPQFNTGGTVPGGYEPPF